MQYVNDDMDELFRKAGEGYPLDTSGADWEKIAKELNGPGQNPVASKRNHRKLLWLLVLIPFSFICNQYFAGTNESVKFNKNKAAIDKTGISSSSQSVRKNSPSSSGIQKEAERYGTKDLGEKNNKIKNLSNLLVRTDAANTPNKISKKERIYTENKNNASNEVGAGDFTIENDLITPRRNQVLALNTKSYPGFTLSSKLASHKNISSLNDKKIQEFNHYKRFYAGLIGGLDATTVKFQKIQDAGYDYGLLLGYQLAKKWSVEAGVFIDKKIYYTKGQYFNVSKLAYRPPNSEVTEVSGDCKMIELPLSVKYNISTSQKSSWFSTVGVSSYLMKKENYDYVYYYGNTGTFATHSKLYENTSKNFFAVTQVSLGYTHKVGSVGDIRVEPYLKIPISRVGFGELPLLSAGLHVGITRKLF